MTIIEKLQEIRKILKAKIDSKPSSMSNNNLEGQRKGLKTAIEEIQKESLNCNFENVFIGIYDINNKPIFTNKHKLLISYQDNLNGNRLQSEAVVIYNKEKLCFEFKIDELCPYTGREFRTMTYWNYQFISIEIIN